MALSKYFRFAFGTAGDKTAIPDTTQPSGAVSYQQAYGPQYELPYSDPNSRNIERPQNNQLHYDITTALQEYQQNGTPDWIDPSQNGGANFAYAIGARVRYTDGVIYESIAAANNTIPTDVTKWIAVGGANVIIPLSNVNVIVSAAPAAQRTIVFTGVLSANIQVTLPARQQQWLIVNNTTGNFTVLVKTAAGSGVVVQQAQATPVYGDGANIVVALPKGRLINVRVFNVAGLNTYNETPGTRAIRVRLQGGGGGGGAAVPTTAGQVSAGAGGGAGGYCESYLTSGFAGGVSISIGFGGGSASNGAATTFPGMSAAGGQAGSTGAAASGGTLQPVGQGTGGNATGGNIMNSQGGYGTYAFYGPSPVGGAGGASMFGAGSGFVSSTAAGNAASSPGAGGGGACALSGQPVLIAGGAGGSGLCIIEEYA